MEDFESVKLLKELLDGMSKEELNEYFDKILALDIDGPYVNSIEEDLLYVEKMICKKYNVKFEDYSDFVDNCFLSRELNEKKYGKKLSDDFYSVLSAVDGYCIAKGEINKFSIH